jgi:hypothetical protein
VDLFHLLLEGCGGRGLKKKQERFVKVVRKEKAAAVSLPLFLNLPVTSSPAPLNLRSSSA